MRKLIFLFLLFFLPNICYASALQNDDNINNFLENIKEYSNEFN